jgi:raffinose/stachyose/melibiose transport system substrate-binding protein
MLSSRRRIAGLIAVIAVVAGSCGTSASPSPSAAAPSAAASPSAAVPSSSAAAAPVTITWWHNANQDPGMTFWKTVADEYTAAHPNVTLQITPTQNEDFKTKLPLALNSDTPPDIFQSWGGGGLKQQVDAAKVQDLSAATASWTSTIIPAALSPYQIDGKQYGIPYDLGLVGFWYNKDLFTAAGIATPPATWDDFIADVAKLKTSGTAPIAVGEKDTWTGAFWWEYLALRECGKDKMANAVNSNSFTDPCFVKAGTDLKQLIDAKPFQDGFLATPAQTGATSSAGLLANGKAAMELMGHWQPGVMGPLTADGKGLGDKLGWFPFPAVTGGAGAVTEDIGGYNGFAVSKDAPPEAADFLKYLAGVDVLSRWGAAGYGLPTTTGSETSITDPNLKELISQRAKATFVQLYLDQAFSQAVGAAINEAVAGQFAGALSPEEVQQAIQTATTK